MMTNMELLMVFAIAYAVFFAVCTVAYIAAHLGTYLWEKTTGKCIEDMFPDWEDG